MPEARVPSTLISVAPAATELGHLLRTAIDAEQVGAARLHLAADQGDPERAIAALRAQTRLVVTAPGDSPGAEFADAIAPAFTEIVLDQQDDPAALVATVATVASTHPGGVSIGARGAAALPVLLAALACGAHIRVGTADGQLDPGGSGPRDDAALAARAAGLARIAGRPPMDIESARDVLVSAPRQTV